MIKNLASLHFLFYNICMRKLIVNDRYNGKNLNKFILDSFPQLNPNELYKALRKKDIRINGIKVSKNTILKKGDEISIYIVDEILEKLPNISIVYEDENILVVNKPNGISVTENSSSIFCLTSILKKTYSYNFLEPCHRIDRNTKGIVLFAKNQQALEILLDKFKNKEIEKHYLARVYGIPKNKTSILEAYLFKDSKKSLVYISDIPKKDYVKIVTEYTLVSSDLKTNTSILDINLHTGKTHQIRAHLSHIGLPILGDGKYGINDINKKFSKKTQELYSYKLIFKFSSSSSILNYLSNKEFSIPINLK